MYSTVKQALKILKPPLKFGNERQIAARQLLEKVYEAKDLMLTCEKKDHKELALERFDEDELTKHGYILALERELDDCSCMPKQISAEVIHEVAVSSISEWWR